jgi:5'(3')-deoxyribonucleotidase
MKKAFICYVDMDGILNLFESDKNARINMWNPGYFLNIPVREGISDILVEINKDSYVVILSKVINRVGVTKEKNIWLNNNISQDAYSDIIYVPYDRSKSDYMYSYYPSMLIDDNESNLAECEKKGCHGLFLSDIKISQKYPNARSLDYILTFYNELVNSL